MTLVSLPSPIAWPGNLTAFSTTPGFFTTATVTSAGHYVAYAFCAREDMTISHVGFRAGTATGSPTIEVRIETLDAAGLPSGTLWATNTNGTTGTVSSNTNPLQALTASASITKGQMFCVMIKYASGTSQIIQHASAGGSTTANAVPYLITNTGTPTKAAMGNHTSLVALGSSSTTFYQVPGALPMSAVTNSAFNNTTAAKRGLRFTPPMKCRAIGLRWYNGTNTGDYNIALYDDTTGSAVELSSSSTAFDGDHSALVNGNAITDYFDNTVTLTAGTTYRIAIEPSSATNVNVSFITLPSVNYRGASPSGTTAHYTTFVTGGWTDTATDQVPLMDLLIDQFDDGANTGGVVGVIGG